MMVRFLFLMMFLVGAHTAFAAANPIREARKTIKAARYEENGNEAKKVTERLENTEKSLLEALAKEDDAKKRVEYYYVAALVQRKFNDIENEKIFLKRPYDTTLYYNSVYKLYQYMAQCDSAESVPAIKKKTYHGTLKKELLANRTNLLNGGRFYLKKKNYPEAYRFLDLYLSSAEYPMFRECFFSQTDTLFPRVAYWASTSAYYAGKYEGVVRYAPIALRYDKDKVYTQEYLCRSYLALNDSASWFSSLKTGLLNFPEHTYFFTNLVTFLNNAGKYDESLAYADRMIQYNPKSELFWHAKSLTYMLKEDYDNCISSCDVILDMDNMNTDANFYKGLAYCKLARISADKMEKEKLESPLYKTYRTEMIACYEKALKPMENVRKKQPKESERWAPLLYQIYLNLNKGTEFAEMDSIMKQMPLAKDK